MKNTNEIDKRIREKSSNELNNIVNEFIEKLSKYESDIYKGIEVHEDKITKEAPSGVYFRTIALGRYPEEVLKELLKSAVQNVYLDNLAAKKTAELLNKLDLI